MTRLAVVVALTSLCLTSIAQIVPSTQNNYTCSANQTCALGCCSSSGYCGFGPTFCDPAQSCVANCYRKAECDGGNWGPQWANASTCPLNVCCSQFGFCGTTPDFCGNATVPQPSCAQSSTTAKQRRVGYYEAWSQQRNCDQMFAEDIPRGAWTHLNFAFVFIDPNDFTIQPMDPHDTFLYQNFTRLKTIAPYPETWISVGGWSMNDPGPWNTTFSNLAASQKAQDAFSASLISFMQQYGFDGVDIDWEYPVAEERAGSPNDLANYVTWLQKLKADLNGQYGLTITIPSSYWYMRHFDIINLSQIVDWFNVMTYDLHGTWDANNPYTGPYVNSHTNLTEIYQTMDLLWRNNIDPNKVTMGLGFYGRSFTLADQTCNHEGCTFLAGGVAGHCTGNVGTLSFAEINRIITANASGLVQESMNIPAAVEEVTWPTAQWVSYDDTPTFITKYQYANSHCIGGLMVWAVSLDNLHGTAHRELCAAIGCNIAIRDPDGNYPVACGTTPNCNLYHQVINGDTCYSLYTGAGISSDQFMAMNPILKPDCSNLDIHEKYCVNGTPDPNITPVSVRSSCLATPTPTPMDPNCHLHTRIVSYGHTMDL